MQVMETDNNSHSESGDYSRFGIPDVPKTTVTTPFGKAKTLAGLFTKEKWFLALSLVNILAAVGLTLYRLIYVAINDPSSSDFTFTLLIIINSVFVTFYAVHGVVRERKYELYVQTLAILIILVYCIAEYSMNKKGHNDVKLARLILACGLAPPNIILAILVARDFGELEFRIAGASEHLQCNVKGSLFQRQAFTSAIKDIYNQAAIFSCWLKFDLQVTVSFVVLVLKEGTANIGTLEIVTLAVGIPYTLFWDIFGWIMLRLELKIGSYLFAFFGLVKPAYYIFKFVRLYQNIHERDEDPTIVTYCVIISGALCLLAWCILMVELVYIYRNFGQGLKERGKITFGSFTLKRSVTVSEDRGGVLP